MTTVSRLALLIAPMLLVACHKKEATPAPAAVVVAPAPVTAPAPTPAAAPAPAVIDPANMTAEQKETARRQELLDYGVMEDKYINDPRAQWATGASASSSYGDKEPSEYYVAAKMIGTIDEKYWRNKNRDIGFEWAQVDYAKPVYATEVRLVLNSGNGEGALNKVELQDVDGKWNTVWTGLSDLKRDKRGPRTWFVRTFPKTAYKVKAVKYTVANNVESGSKEFDAAQLVGE
jgi:hypothetical protein